METVPLKPADSVSITMLVDNSIDALLAGDEEVRRSPWVRVENPLIEDGYANATLTAEHGFSALVTLTVGGESHRLLFDAGVSPDGMMANIDRLQLNPKDIEAVVLSHGHFDHTGGLEGLSRRLGRSGLPLLAHRKAYTKRRSATPNGPVLPLPPPSKSALAGAGFELVDADDPSLLFKDALLLTGEIPRRTDFEPGMPPSHQALGPEGWAPEPHLADDQAMVVNVADKGLVILTGCGHAGIINIVERAKEITGIDRVHAVLGGFHLPGAFYEAYIPQTVDALVATGAHLVVPAHCTGYKATHEIARAMPDAFVQNAVGTTFAL